MTIAPPRIWAWGHDGDRIPIRGFATKSKDKGVEYVRADLLDATTLVAIKKRLDGVDPNADIKEDVPHHE